MKNKKIAIPVNQDGILDGHFGHCKFFALYTIKDNQIVSEEILIPPPHEPGLLPRWLAEKGVGLVIAGGMGSRAQDIFQQNGIQVVVGTLENNPEQAVLNYLNGELATGGNVCDH